MVYLGHTDHTRHSPQTVSESYQVAQELLTAEIWRQEHRRGSPDTPISEMQDKHSQ